MRLGFGGSRWSVVSVPLALVTGGAALMGVPLAAMGNGVGATERVSLRTDGAEGLRQSYFAPAISADGRFVAFASGSALVADDTNRKRDVFVRDRLAGTTERISVSSQEAQGDRGSHYPAISSDGRYVAFVSGSELVAGDGNFRTDVFVRDRVRGTTERVSVRTNGTEGHNDNYLPAISGDGRYVAFQSKARLVAGDTNRERDVFVRDLDRGVTRRVSVSSHEVLGNGRSGGPSLSEDGRYVAFDSRASNLVAGDTNNRTDVFVRDRLRGTTRRVSVGTDGTQGNSDSSLPSISADGRHAAFSSYASNLVAGDSNESADVFVRDRRQGTTQRESVSSDGPQTGSDGGVVSISADGRYVAFPSGWDLVDGDTNAMSDVFVRDRVSETTQRVSVSSGGTQGNGHSGFPAISADGRYVGFTSLASNLVAGDTNSFSDVFVHDRGVG